MEKYDFGRKIGQGSYATVYLVRHKATGAVYVAKEMSLENISAKEYAAMETEIRLLAKLHHPGIVQYVESFLVGTPAHTIFIIMGYCEGGDLTRFIRNRDGETLSEKEVLHFLVQLLLALEYLHSENIMHRDLKPGNVFISNGYLQLGDLGIAKELTSTSNMALTCIGTPYYMSPELFQNKPYNHKSDVWALGCLIYETACFRRPFEANTITSLAQKVTAGVFSPLSSSFSRNMRLLVKKLLALTPTARPELRDLLLAGFIRQRVLTYTRSLVADAALFSPAALATLRTQLLRLGLAEAATLIPIDPSSRPSSAQPARPVPFAAVRHHALAALEDGDSATAVAVAASSASLLSSRATSPRDVSRDSADTGPSRSLPLLSPEPALPPQLRDLLGPSRGGHGLVESAVEPGVEAACVMHPSTAAAAHGSHYSGSSTSTSPSPPRTAPLPSTPDTPDTPDTQTPMLGLADMSSDIPFPRQHPPQQPRPSDPSRAPTPTRDTRDASITTAPLALRTPRHPPSRPTSRPASPTSPAPMPRATIPGVPDAAAADATHAQVPRSPWPRSTHRQPLPAASPPLSPPLPPSPLSPSGARAQSLETATPGQLQCVPASTHVLDAHITHFTAAPAPGAACVAARTPHLLGGLAVDECAYLPLAAPARARYCPSYTHERGERATPPVRQSTACITSTGTSADYAPVATLALAPRDRGVPAAQATAMGSYTSQAGPVAAHSLSTSCVSSAAPPVQLLEAGARACLALLKQRHGGASAAAAGAPTTPDALAEALAVQLSPSEPHAQPLSGLTLPPHAVEHQTTMLPSAIAPKIPPDLATDAHTAMVTQSIAAAPPVPAPVGVALSPFDRDKLRAVRRRASTATAATAGSVGASGMGSAGSVGGPLPESHVAADDPEHAAVSTPSLPSLTRLDRVRPRVGCEAASSVALPPPTTATAIATASPAASAPPATSTSFSSAFQAALIAQTSMPASVTCVSDARISCQYPTHVAPLRADPVALPRGSSAAKKHSSQVPVLPADPQLQPLAPPVGYAAAPGADLWAAQLQRAARVLPRESLRDAYALLYARHTRAEAQLSDAELHARLHALLGGYAEELLPLLHDIVFSACSQGM